MVWKKVKRGIHCGASVRHTAAAAALRGRPVETAFLRDPKSTRDIIYSVSKHRRWELLESYFTDLSSADEISNGIEMQGCSEELQAGSKNRRSSKAHLKGKHSFANECFVKEASAKVSTKPELRLLLPRHLRSHWRYCIFSS